MRSKIYYNLKQSDYTQDVLSGMNVWTFYFSSELNLRRFCNRVRDEVVRIDRSLSKRFHVEISWGLIGALMTYVKVEKRGFYIIINDAEEALCLEDLKLSGPKISLLNSDET